LGSEQWIEQLEKVTGRALKPQKRGPKKSEHEDQSVHLVNCHRNWDHFSEDTRDEFEPAEAHKGDLARAVFYFCSVYPGRAGDIGRISQDGLDMLFQRHQKDLPDAWERQRNGRIEAVQGNRNPFVDHPEWVCRAWGFVCP
jgi:endonuclease I